MKGLTLHNRQTVKKVLNIYRFHTKSYSLKILFNGKNSNDYQPIQEIFNFRKFFCLRDTVRIYHVGAKTVYGY